MKLKGESMAKVFVKSETKLSIKFNVNIKVEFNVFFKDALKEKFVIKGFLMLLL